MKFRRKKRFFRRNNAGRSSNTHFATVPQIKAPRSVFRRNHTVKTTFDSGWLVPVMVEEVIPGDTFNLEMTSFLRLTTPIYPTMDNIILNVQAYFVPTRLTWNKWEKFWGDKEPGEPSYTGIVPQLILKPGEVKEHSIFDYYGLPLNPDFQLSVNALPFVAYNLIYNEHFRDQNLQKSIPIDINRTRYNSDDFWLKKRGKRADYFNSALPFPQKGPQVMLPLGDKAPVVGGGLDIENPKAWHQGADPGPVTPHDINAWVPDKGMNSIQTAPKGGATNYAFPVTRIATEKAQPWNWYANLASATAQTVNTIRQAFQLQRFYEKSARGGTRYTELVESQYGVSNPDARLQRPERLRGGGDMVVRLSSVPQTNSTDKTSPQGNLAAFGVSGSSMHFHGSFTEHGYVIVLVSARADYAYQQGLDRMFSRETPQDFAIPVFANLGEQVVKNKEIYCDGTPEDDGVFGYQERYAEYRFRQNQITGYLRSTSRLPLDAWHYGLFFGRREGGKVVGVRPRLNAGFIEENPPIKRTLAVQDMPDFIADFAFSNRLARRLPLFGVPGRTDHG